MRTVSVIDVTTATVTATIPVGSAPAAVAVDPSTHTLYVATSGDTVSVIDVALPTPVITVTSSRNPSSFGQKVTLTAKADPADGGTMTFADPGRGEGRVQ